MESIDRSRCTLKENNNIINIQVVDTEKKTEFLDKSEEVAFYDDNDQENCPPDIILKENKDTVINEGNLSESSKITPVDDTFVINVSDEAMENNVVNSHNNEDEVTDAKVKNNYLDVTVKFFDDDGSEKFPSSRESGDDFSENLESEKTEIFKMCSSEATNFTEDIDFTSHRPVRPRLSIITNFDPLYSKSVESSRLSSSDFEDLIGTNNLLPEDKLVPLESISPSISPVSQSPACGFTSALVDISGSSLFYECSGGTQSDTINTRVVIDNADGQNIANVIFEASEEYALNLKQVVNSADVQIETVTEEFEQVPSGNGAEELVDVVQINVNTDIKDELLHVPQENLIADNVDQSVDSKKTDVSVGNTVSPLNSKLANISAADFEEPAQLDQNFLNVVNVEEQLNHPTAVELKEQEETTAEGSTEQSNIQSHPENSSIMLDDTKLAEPADNRNIFDNGYLQEMSEQLTNVRTECERYKQQTVELRKELKVTRQKSSNVEIELAETKKQVNELKILIDDYETQIAEYSNNSGRTETIVKINNDGEDLLLHKKKQEELRKENDDLKEKITQLEISLTESKKELTSKINTEQETRRVTEEYESSISRLLVDNEKLKSEFATSQTHLTNIENAFSDLHQKYERSKALVTQYKENEEVLKSHVEMNEKTINQQEARYETLKNHALTQLEKSNQDLAAVKTAYDREATRLHAVIKRLEIKVNSLTELLEQKTKECIQINQICDEIVNKKS